MRKILFYLLPIVLANYSFANSKIDSLNRVAQNSNLEVPERANAYKILAQNYLYTSLDSGLFYVEKGLILARNNRVHIQEAELLQTKGLLYLSFYENEKGMANLKDAIIPAEKTKNDSILAVALLETGHQYALIGQWDSSIVYSEYCIQVAKEANQLDLLFKANNNVGNCYLDLADFPAAQNAYSDALQVNEILNEPKYDAIIHVNLGRMEDNMVNYDKAIAHYSAALEYAIPNNEMNYLRIIYANIAGIQIELGQYREAVKNLKKAIEINKATNNKFGESWNYNGLGIAYFMLEENDTALYYHQRAIDLKVEIGDSSHLGYIFNGKADIYVSENETEKAINELEKTLTLVKRFPDPSVEAYTLMLLGQIKLEKNEREGLAYFKQSIEIAENYGFKTIGRDICEYKFAYFEKKGDFKQAYENYRKFTEFYEEILGEERKLAIQEIEIKHQVDQKDNEISILEQNRKIKDLQLINAEEKSKVNLQITILIFGIVLLIIVILVLYFRQKQRNKLSEVEKRNLKIETDKLRSQINPHFIFNSLNSIQSFISGNEGADAERYLAKFSKLMRLILENSRAGFIDFEKELETLKLYMDLEQLRFNNQFEYTLTHDGIDEEFTQIPPMLAQPHIENAILHGVRTLKNGVINVHYERIGEKIRCTVADNGVGRSATALQKSQHTSNRKSLGTAVTKERIELLAQAYELNLIVEIIDKIDAENQPIGTKVIVEMPWIQ